MGGQTNRLAWWLVVILSVALLGGAVKALHTGYFDLVHLEGWTVGCGEDECGEPLS